ncbi:MAG: Veg family protein [Clostridia bacterium]|nr:Veg family protein [Clostridia bacterium]
MTINSIKQNIRDCYKKAVTVKLNLGRNKFVTFPATLSGIYSSIFTVEPFDKNFLGKTAYSYSEIMCGKVFITLAEKRA